MLFVNRAHQRSSWWQHLVDKDKDCLLRCKLDPLADHVDELAYGQVLIGEVAQLAHGPKR